ncbi:hypothetical protein E6H35_03975 [Candidatus Bathyarchaeota archaeon]|nr:MAG: hypothetical protein E6H35_03975 [Candidatus Bathyarchaeota archaeon]
MAVYPIVVERSTESHGATASKFNLIPISDFTVGASHPSIVPADGTTSATAIILVSPINGFTGTVALSDLPLPADLSCTAIHPAAIPNSSGEATVSCTSRVPGAYDVTIFGTSGEIRHNATATFTFTTSAAPDFTITAVSSVSLTADTTATSNVTVTPQGGFHSEVNVTATVYPSTGLSVSLIPQRLVLGSGTATARFSASAPGDYTVTITGISKSHSHMITIVVAVTLAGLLDFEISASFGSINIEAGNPGVTRLIITPSSGFTGPVTLAVAAPAGISCSLSPTSIQSSGTSTLTCSSGRPGLYTITIKATGGTSTHTATVNVHVATLSPAAPAPSTILGLAPAIFYVVIAGIIAVVVAGAVLFLRPRGSRPNAPKERAIFSRCTSSDQSCEHASGRRPVQTSSACIGPRVWGIMPRRASYPSPPLQLSWSRPHRILRYLLILVEISCSG